MSLIKNKTKLIIIMLIFSLCLYGCNKNDESEKLSKKVVQQVEYLDIELIEMLNDLNRISFENYKVTTNLVEASNSTSEPDKQGENEENSKGSDSKNSGESNKSNPKSSLTISQIKANNILSTDRENIDWERIKTKIEEFYLSWSVIIADLYKKNVSVESILTFSEQLDLCIADIKKEDKQATLTNLGKLYSALFNIYNNLEKTNSDKKIQEVKMNIINAYTLVNLDGWDEITKQLNLAEENLKFVLEDFEALKDKEYKINKIYVILKELQKSIVLKDKDVFYIKYKNIMEQLKTW